MYEKNSFKIFLPKSFSLLIKTLKGAAGSNEVQI